MVELRALPDMLKIEIAVRREISIGMILYARLEPPIDGPV